MQTIVPYLLTHSVTCVHMLLPSCRANSTESKLGSFVCVPARARNMVKHGKSAIDNSRVRPAASFMLGISEQLDAGMGFVAAATVCDGEKLFSRSN